MFARKCLWHSSAMMKMKETSESGSVVAILERELEPMVREWLKRVSLVPELIQIPLINCATGTKCGGRIGNGRRHA